MPYGPFIQYRTVLSFSTLRSFHSAPLAVLAHGHPFIQYAAVFFMASGSIFPFKKQYLDMLFN